MLSRRGGRRPNAGFGLIEMVVAVAILGLAMAMAAPSFADWMRNVRIRAAAESLQNGLHFARTEATRRNALVRFQLTTTLDSACAESAEGTHWVVNLGRTSPAGHCATVSAAQTPFILKAGSVRGSEPQPVVLQADRALVAFDGLGRLSELVGVTRRDMFAANLTLPGVSCLASGGTLRCLRVVVSPAGQIRLCDPTHTASGDPLSCPADS